MCEDIEGVRQAVPQTTLLHINIKRRVPRRHVALQPGRAWIAKRVRKWKPIGRFGFRGRRGVGTEDGDFDTAPPDSTHRITAIRLDLPLDRGMAIGIENNDGA